MFLTIIIAFVGLIGLIVSHEFGHFIIAKRFGVKVEEFGIGYPPRLFGRKFGETVYSLNLLPFGAFVKLPGEIEKTDDPRSFSRQSILKRALIVAGGVISFWIISIIIFGVVSGLGSLRAVGDEEIIPGAKVQVAAVSNNSPAKTAGLLPGDAILNFKRVKEMQEFTDLNKGKEIILTVERGKEILEVSLTPRVSPPQGEGPMGVALVRTAVKSYPWYEAPWQGISQTVGLTWAIIHGYFEAIANLFKGEPTGVSLTGPVGVFSLLSQASQMGIVYFLNFLRLISLYLAVFNLLPIPAVDGGKLMFLGIEAIRKKAVSEKIEQRLTTAFFLALILLMIWVTIGDVRKLF